MLSFSLLALEDTWRGSFISGGAAEVWSDNLDVCSTDLGCCEIEGGGMEKGLELPCWISGGGSWFTMGGGGQWDGGGRVIGGGCENTGGGGCDVAGIVDVATKLVGGRKGPDIGGMWLLGLEFDGGTL